MAGIVSDSFFSSLASSGSPIGTVLLNRREAAREIDSVAMLSRYKLQVFAVGVSSLQDLKDILIDVKNSKWWNHMAKFYIFSSGREIKCSEPWEFLWAAWEMDILGAKFICDDEGPLVYMFNPYTKKAPSQWKFERTYSGRNEHPWSLFVRKHHGTMGICENIDFDQTRETGGYEFCITAFEALILPNFEKTGKFSPFVVTNSFLSLMSRYMDVRFKANLHPPNETIGYVDGDGKGHGLVADLVDGRSDLMIMIVPLSDVPQLPGLYSYAWRIFDAVTQYTGYPSQWEKVISAIDYPSRIGLGVIILVNLIFMKYVFHESFMKAFLNTLRIVCNSCLIELPRDFASRIYLTGLFCFFIIIQALYQGQLAARLSQQDRYTSVNNREDLMNSDYVIHGHKMHGNAFSEDVYEGRFFAVPSEPECLDLLLKNASIACVSTKGHLIDAAIKLKLHMSKNPVAEFPMRYVLRENWPLEEKFYRHIAQRVEAGTYSHWYKVHCEQGMRIIENNENPRSSDSHKVLMLKDMDFAFVILAFGLACSTIVFVVELLFVNRRHSSRRNKPVRLAWQK